MTPLKKCTKCGEEKPATTEFFFFLQGRGKLQSQCKECRAAAHKRWRRANKACVKKAKQRYRLRNPEKYKESTLQWRVNNPDKIIAYRKKAGKKWRLNLSDGYIKTLMRGRAITPTPDKIELYKLIIKSKRTYNEIHRRLNNN